MTNQSKMDLKAYDVTPLENQELDQVNGGGFWAAAGWTALRIGAGVLIGAGAVTGTVAVGLALVVAADAVGLLD